MFLTNIIRLSWEYSCTKFLLNKNNDDNLKVMYSENNPTLLFNIMLLCVKQCKPCDWLSALNEIYLPSANVIGNYIHINLFHNIFDVLIAQFLIDIFLYFCKWFSVITEGTEGKEILFQKFILTTQQFWHFNEYPSFDNALSLSYLKEIVFRFMFPTVKLVKIGCSWPPFCSHYFDHKENRNTGSPPLTSLKPLVFHRW